MTTLEERMKDEDAILAEINEMVGTPVFPLIAAKYDELLEIIGHVEGEDIIALVMLATVLVGKRPQS